ncbi:retron Ec48 family effector membrane protein [Rahnella sp. PCH160]|uniref:retron Ec48 family effector membrane protein n=1 Tax=Rahnella sp. PCH160 TaxID=3447928 RepID=UPI0039FC33B2
MKTTQKINSILVLGVVISLVAISGAVLGIYSFHETYKIENLSQKEFCLASKCLVAFAEKTEGVIKIFEVTAWLLTIIATIGGMFVALMTYRTGIRNSNLSNHISHLNMFRDFINAEILKRKYLTPERINIYQWYVLIFPDSKYGDVKVSRNYDNSISDIKSIVNVANEKISEATGKYDYRTHQFKMIASLSEIGIKISNGAKNEFIAVELQVFDLIDCVNMTFTDVSIELTKLERKYT